MCGSSELPSVRCSSLTRLGVRRRLTRFESTVSAYYSSFRFDPPAVGFADLASGVEQALVTGEVPLPSGVSSAMRSNGAGRGYLIAVTMAMMGIVLRSDERNGSDVQ